ncbi:MAG TPA: hypothetical protein PLK94_08155, partial [Alphaproteobacteria bacterium]|nr:hypothetical protein [Alphaproteobacteria bacterium]HOO51241.1 hypothetical protein [Alphaproteobacteria bacterium]
MDNNKRYYFHGDIIEQGKYFCARCDLKVDISHYYEFVHNADDVGDEDIKRFWSMQKAGVPKGYFRPKDAENYIE